MKRQFDDKVSVIIPAYNAVKYLRETVASVLSQSYTNFDLYLIDDGSTDDTKGLIQKLAKLDERVKPIYKENGGVSSARNTGFRHSDGPLVSFLDADDVWERDFLASCVFLLQNRSNCGLVYADMKIIDHVGELSGEVKVGVEGNILNDLLKWERHLVSPPSGCVIKRAVLDNVGLFDESLSNNADQDLNIRIASRYKICKTKEPLLRYRVHRSNMHGNIPLMERDTLRTFSKARASDLFYDKTFMRRCFANMYLIIGFSYLRHKNNLWKFLQFSLRAFVSHPFKSVQIIATKLS